MDNLQKLQQLEELIEGEVFEEILNSVKMNIVDQEDQLMYSVGLSDDELFTAMKRLVLKRQVIAEIGVEISKALIEARNNQSFE